MSARDAVGRRRFAIQALLRDMQITVEGWKLGEMVGLLVREYGYGIRDKTAVEIIQQLTKHGRIYKKGAKWYFKQSQ